MENGQDVTAFDAMLVVMNKTHSFIISGDGNVIEPDNDIVAIGSGGGFAMAAATALKQHSKLSAKDIAVSALKTAGKIRNHIEKPEALRTTNSLFLFNFIYVCIELKRNTVGKIIGNKLGI